MKSLTRILVLGLVVLAVFGAKPFEHKLANGVKVQGTQVGKVVAFKGIPYAEPPVGEMRWKKAVLKTSMPGTWNATSFGADCYNLIPTNSLFKPSGPESEDCLFINVWSPVEALSATQNQRLRSVVVFIHGGGFILGSGAHPIIAPAPEDFVATNDVVYVTLNYRLGPLGFLVHDSISDSKRGADYNFGLEDQRLALQWVKMNIKSFGGSPQHVTLMGESAGAMSICFHMTSPSSQHLFQRVIMQSTICDFKYSTLERAQQQAAVFVDALGCGGRSRSLQSIRECLSAKSPKEIQYALPLPRGMTWGEGYRWFPVLEEIGEARTFNQKLPISKAALQEKDILLGSNEEEASMFVFNGFPIYFPKEYVRKTLEISYPPPKYQNILTAYNIENSSDYFTADMVIQMMSEAWECSTHRLAMSLSSIARSVRVYEFAIDPSWLDYPIVRSLGTFHGLELPFVFGTGNSTFNEREREVSKRMIELWGWFSKTKQLDKATWPTYHSSEGATVLRIEDHDFEYGNRPSICDVWDSTIDSDGCMIDLVARDEPLYSWVLNDRVPKFSQKIRTSLGLSFLQFYALVGITFLLVSMAICWRLCCVKSKKTKAE